MFFFIFFMLETLRHHLSLAIYALRVNCGSRSSTSKSKPAIKTHLQLRWMHGSWSGETKLLSSSVAIHMFRKKTTWEIMQSGSLAIIYLYQTTSLDWEEKHDNWDHQSVSCMDQLIVTERSVISPITNGVWHSLIPWNRCLRCRACPLAFNGKTRKWHLNVWNFWYQSSESTPFVDHKID